MLLTEFFFATMKNIFSSNVYFFILKTHFLKVKILFFDLNMIFLIVNIFLLGSKTNTNGLSPGNSDLAPDNSWLGKGRYRSTSDIQRGDERYSRRPYCTLLVARGGFCVCLGDYRERESV